MIYFTERIKRFIAWLNGNDVVYFTFEPSPLGWLALASVLLIVVAAVTLALKNR